MSNKLYWITGSQSLYGEEAIKSVERNSIEIVKELNKKISSNIVFLDVAKSNDEVINAIKKANNDDECIGIIVWMHTFSPAKMWINGLKILQKPMIHFATQFVKTIPWESIDMDFMNLNQSAHGDREFGFIASRMNIKREVVVGHYQNELVQSKIKKIINVFEGVQASKTLKIARFGDNMRNVAVTEGDKIEAQIKMGWQVDYYAVGDLVQYVKKVTDDQVESLLKTYKNEYEWDPNGIDESFFLEQVKYQAKLEIAIESFLSERGYSAFTTNFEDLHGLEQLPGLACQNLMKKGYGFAGEGDWKTAGMLSIIKKIAGNQQTTFMEDYTYNLELDNELVLGSHMLEVCPTISCEKPKIKVSKLEIGQKSDPARLAFKSLSGSGVCLSLIDKRHNFELIATDIELIQNQEEMPNLPLGKCVWKIKPDFYEGVKKWIEFGGAHHTVLSLKVDKEDLSILAKFLDIKFEMTF